MCKVWVTADVLFCSASIYSLIGISIDRFHAIYKPISYTNSNGFHTNTMIIMAWLIALAIALPMHIDYPGFSNWYRSFKIYQEDHQGLTACSPPHDAESAGFSFYAAFLAFIIPFVILIVFYFAVAVKMRSRTKKKIKRIKKKVVTCSKLIFEIYFFKVAVWASPSSKSPLEAPSSCHLKVPGQNMTDSAIFLENSAAEDGDISDTSFSCVTNVDVYLEKKHKIARKSDVYLGNGQEIARMARKQLKREEAFQRRFKLYDSLF